MIVQPPSVSGQFGQPQTYLITDTGEKYPLTDANAEAALGYGSLSAQAMPSEIPGFLATGPSLSVAAAWNTVAP